MVVRVFTTLFCLLVCHLVSAQTETNSPEIVHFRVAEKFLIIVPVWVGEAGPFDFLVDTGTNTTLIDPALADELRLKPTDRVKMMTPAGSMAIPRARLGILKVGPILMQQMEVLVQPLAAVQHIDRHIRGILGSNFFDHFDYLMDYEHSELVFDLDHSQSNALRGERVALISSGCPSQGGKSDFVEVEIQISPFESKPLRLQLDSGIKSPALYASLDQRTFVKDSRRTMQVTSNLGETTAEVLPVRQLKVGEQSFSDVPFAVIPNRQLASATCADGLLPSWLLHSLFVSHSGKFIIVKPAALTQKKEDASAAMVAADAP